MFSLDGWPVVANCAPFDRPLTGAHRAAAGVGSGVPSFPYSARRVTAKLIYSTVVPTAVSPVRPVSTSGACRTSGEGIAHALHEGHHGDRRNLRDHAHDEDHRDELEEEQRNAQAPRNDAPGSLTPGRHIRTQREGNGGRHARSPVSVVGE